MGLITAGSGAALVLLGAVLLAPHREAALSSFASMPALGERIFNDYAVGAELRAAGKAVFIDASMTPLLEKRAVVDDYFRLIRLENSWEEVLRKWNFSSAVLREDSSLRTVLRERLGWREIHRTEKRIFRTPLGAYELAYVVLVPS
jgi:hypothetical protein